MNRTILAKHHDITINTHISKEKRRRSKTCYNLQSMYNPDNNTTWALDYLESCKNNDDHDIIIRHDLDKKSNQFTGFFSIFNKFICKDSD